MLNLFLANIRFGTTSEIGLVIRLLYNLWGRTPQCPLVIWFFFQHRPISDHHHRSSKNLWSWWLWKSSTSTEREDHSSFTFSAALRTAVHTFSSVARPWEVEAAMFCLRKITWFWQCMHNMHYMCACLRENSAQSLLRSSFETPPFKLIIAFRIVKMTF